MAEGVRRDEWDRFGQLLALVHNGLDFGGKNRRQPASFWPESLIKQADKEAAATASTVPRVDFAYVKQAVLGNQQ